MHGKSAFCNSILWTISLAAVVALLVLLAAVPAWAQNPVPPTAREAAASPATPPALNKSQTAAPARSGRASPQKQASCDGSSPQCDEWMYSNGPVNGNDNAWPICCGYVVSNSFVMQYGGYIGWIYFYIWKSPGDVLSSVQWSITSEPNGGTVYGSGTASYLGDNLSDDYILTNQYGYDVDIVSISMFLSGLSAGTYWINLFNADAEVAWDQNSGAGCQSYGCPSQAYDSASGSIPSEAFDIGNNDAQPPPCFQAGGNLQVIHDFTGQQDGSRPNGLVTDKVGNLYGTSAGGVNGAGLAYELSPKGQGWVFDPLYSFPGGSNGEFPAPVTLGPGGALYGTAEGGLLNCRPGPSARETP